MGSTHLYNGNLISGERRKSVFGTPTSLLKLPWVNITLNFSPRTAETSSLVVVLPLVPVIPTTGISKCRRCSRASSLKVVRQSLRGCSARRPPWHTLFHPQSHRHSLSPKPCRQTCCIKRCALQSQEDAALWQSRLSVVITGCAW